ncbi:hypothetical protein ON010_g10774 [Phytophthora cinnamomi]|nr:hypothetical protein ON010_g10774 [Phytophthora cinnamomi]
MLVISRPGSPPRLHLYLDTQYHQIILPGKNKILGRLPPKPNDKTAGASLSVVGCIIAARASKFALAPIEQRHNSAVGDIVPHDTVHAESTTFLAR